MPDIQALTTWIAINACNDDSPSGVTDRTTGVTQYIGDLDLGVFVDLTEAEANQNSYTVYGTLHAGRYRRVLVDSGATAANIKTGTIGLLRSKGLGVNVVTSYDQGLAAGLRKVVFLNAVTPGKYCFIQELGDATVLGDNTIGNGNSIGQYAAATTGGTVNTSSGAGYGLLTVGKAIETPTANTLFRVLLELPVFQD